jgi:hypothetical protein
MSGTPLTRAQLQAQQRTTREAAAAAATVAAEAAAAAPNAAAQSAAPAAGAGGDPIMHALIRAMNLNSAAATAASAAALAESQAARADAAAASFEAYTQRCRAAAGSAPQFMGQTNCIAVHQWVIEMERWFKVAHIAADDDEDRLVTAASVLRGAAQIWWTAKEASGESAALNTWALFSAAIRKHFLPSEVERWAHMELKMLTTKSAQCMRMRIQ